MSYDLPGPAQPDPSQPPPYGQPPAPQPSVQPSGQPNPYGASPTYGAALPHDDYAHWGKRVAATLIDALLTLLAAIPVVIGFGILIASTETRTAADGTVTTTMDDVNPIALVLILLGFLAYVGFYIWNIFIRQGRTGYSVGKGVLGIKLVKEDTGQPIGAGLCFVRQICHVLDGFCYLGYLWPLWDAKRQTFADKIVSTVVVNAPTS